MSLRTAFLLSVGALGFVIPMSNAGPVSFQPWPAATCTLVDNDYCSVAFEWDGLGAVPTIGVVGEFAGDYEYAITNEVRTAGFRCYGAAGPVASENGFSATEDCFWTARTWPAPGVLRLFCYSQGTGALGCFASN